ncbi:MAG: hypothetical protein FWC26_06315 [Fibromonadales bacterium]|nr:hypothetical protein [Fibromonadales bacterium]
MANSAEQKTTNPTIKEEWLNDFADARMRYPQTPASNCRLYALGKAMERGEKVSKDSFPSLAAFYRMAKSTGIIERVRNIRKLAATSCLMTVPMYYKNDEISEERQKELAFLLEDLRKELRSLCLDRFQKLGILEISLSYLEGSLFWSASRRNPYDPVEHTEEIPEDVLKNPKEILSKAMAAERSEHRIVRSLRRKVI